MGVANVNPSICYFTTRFRADVTLDSSTRLYFIFINYSSTKSYIGVILFFMTVFLIWWSAIIIYAASKTVNVMLYIKMRQRDWRL